MTDFKLPPKAIWNADYWLRRAEEARTAGEALSDRDCQRIMFEIADTYEHLARQSQEFYLAARRKAERSSDARLGGTGVRPS